MIKHIAAETNLEALFDIQIDNGNDTAPAAGSSAIWAGIKCRKCKGTGKFIGYTGRTLGDCFACNGKGIHVADRDTPAINVSKIEAAFESARTKAKRPGMMGVWTRPLTLRSASGIDVRFQPGSAGSQWEGMIFAKSGDKKLGYVKAGAFHARRECTAEEQAAVIETAADPFNAAKAYGKAWSVCTVCGQTLTNDKSIALGIGPICKERYGW